MEDAQYNLRILKPAGLKIQKLWDVLLFDGEVHKLENMQLANLYKYSCFLHSIKCYRSTTFMNGVNSKINQVR